MLCPTPVQNLSDVTFAIGVSLSSKSILFTLLNKSAVCLHFPGFFQECNLKRHMASHSVQDGGQGFKCTHCSATFTTKSVLTVHMRDAHGEKSKSTAKKSVPQSTQNNGTPQQSLLKTNLMKTSPKVHKSPNAIIRSPTNTPTG